MQTRYAKVGDAHVAYRTWGAGPPDLLVVVAEYIPVDMVDEEPRLARCIQRLASFSRVTLFNHRSVGLSDPLPGTPSVEGMCEDILGVLDAIGSAKATIFTWDWSGPVAITFASMHPDRVASLILCNTWASTKEIEASPQFESDYAERLTDPAGTELDLLAEAAPSVAGDERFRAWWDRAGRRALGPAMARVFWKTFMQADAKDLLSELRVPTLVLQREDVTAVPAVGQDLADRIAGARFASVPGADQLWWVGDVDPILDQIEAFVCGGISRTRGERMLATVLFTDVVGSTERAANIGDRRWRELLATLYSVGRQEIDNFSGRHVQTTGDGVLATFAMPADAIRCARALTAAVRALGIEIRAGIHTGEIEIVGDDVAGIGVHIASRVMSMAGPGEVLVSRTVADLVTGSGIALQDRGERELKGVPGTWALFAVKE